ncbi:MAG: Arc family DNA-binding protein [Pseudomonadota bacterium]
MATEKPFPSDAAEKFVVRFPEGMRDRIAASAKVAARSMNAEVVHRLARSFESENELEEYAFKDGFDSAGKQIEIEELKAENAELRERLKLHFELIRTLGSTVNALAAGTQPVDERNRGVLARMAEAGAHFAELGLPEGIKALRGAFSELAEVHGSTPTL